MATEKKTEAPKTEAPAKPEIAEPKIIAVLGGPSKELRYIHRIDELNGVTSNATIRELTAKDLDAIDQSKTPVKTFVDRSLAEKYANEINTAVLTRRAQIHKKDAKTRARQEAYLREHPERKLPLQRKRKDGELAARLTVLEAHEKKATLLKEKEAKAKLAEEIGKET